MPKKMHRTELERRITEMSSGKYSFVCWDGDSFGSRERVRLKCNIDGKEWSAVFYSLKNGGSGCPECKARKLRDRLITPEAGVIERIERSGDISFLHWIGDYVGVHSVAKMRCNADGFEWSTQVAGVSYGVAGCPQCSGKRRWTADERVVHINNIDGIVFVSWVGDYKNAFTRARVACEKCGHAWSSTIDNIVNQGKGCPKCSKHGFNKGCNGYLYALRSECGRYVKVGISNNPTKRHSRLRRATPFKFVLIEQISGKGDEIYEMECMFHNKYESAGFAGFDGATEWLMCTDDLLKELIDVAQ